MCFNKKIFDCVWQGEELTICYTGLLTPNHIRFTPPYQLLHIVSSKKELFPLIFLPQTGSIQANEALPVLLPTVPGPYRGGHPSHSTQVPSLRWTRHRRHLHGLPTAHGPGTGPAGNWVHRQNLHGLPTAHGSGTGPAGNLETEPAWTANSTWIRNRSSR